MNFNWILYKSLNPDLSRAGLKTKQDYERHYQLYGKKEGRKINRTKPLLQNKKNINNKPIPNENKLDSNNPLHNYILFLNNKYSPKHNITSFNIDTDDHLLDTLFNKLYPDEKISNKLYLFHKKFNRNDIVNLIRTENYTTIHNFRLQIDNILLKYNTHKKLDDNEYIKNITYINSNKSHYYFGIVIPVYNRHYITKIFIECLKHNVNYDSIIFCIVDDGSELNVLQTLYSLHTTNLNFIIVETKKRHNPFNSSDTKVPGSMFPMTLYIGHELLKHKCDILGVLDSDTFINENYFNLMQNIIQTHNNKTSIYSGFNSHSPCHSILDKITINNNDILIKNMVGAVSQFYHVELYEQFKYCLTGELSTNFVASDFDFQISSFMNKNNYQYICLSISYLQHVGIKSTMIRNNLAHNHDDLEIINTIKQLLLEPNYIKQLQYNFDFDPNFVGSKNIDLIFNKVV